MNNLKLKLENFQSISSGELDFVTGLNFIIGQSNSGKSATFRALKACLCNPSGSQRFIKKGTVKTSVFLEYNGNIIIWNRTQKDNSYTINGEEYLKTGKGNAFKLLPDETGFVQGDGDIVMNIEEELQLPFPFGYNKSELFKLYENVFCVSDSATILKSAKEHEGRVKFDLDMLEVDLNKNKVKLQELKELKKEVSLREIEKHLEDCRKSHNRLGFLKADLDVIHNALKASQIMTDISPYESKGLLEKYQELLGLKSLVQKVKRVHSLNKELPQYPSFSLNKIEIYGEKLKLARLRNQCKKFLEIDVKIVNFNNKLNDYLTKVSLDKVAKQCTALSSINLEIIEFNKNLLEQYKSLCTYKKELRSIFLKGKEKTELLERAKERLIELEEKLKGFKVCPLCHKPL